MEKETRGFGVLGFWGFGVGEEYFFVVKCMFGCVFFGVSLSGMCERSLLMLRSADGEIGVVCGVVSTRP